SISSAAYMPAMRPPLYAHGSFAFFGKYGDNRCGILDGGGATRVLGELIIGYLFFGGMGAAMLAMLGVREILHARHALLPACNRGMGFLGEQASWPPYDEGAARAWAACAFCLCLGSLLLFVDLGRPERVFQFLLSSRLSVMTVGAYALGASVVCSLAFAAEYFFDSVSFPRVPRVLLGVVSLLSGMLTATYTGVLLQSMNSVVFWQTPLLPMLFLVSSFSCAAACIAASVSSCDMLAKPSRFVRRLLSFDMVLIAFEGACVFLYLVLSFISNDARLAVRELLSGELSTVFWLGVVLLGLVTPLVLEAKGLRSPKGSSVCICALFVLAGGIFLRFCIVSAAAYDITNTPEFIYGLSIGAV
ncbi:NrfD/PsrC family molybdoenzyme membrane anchor subunit, partial [Slackia piriformis]|uniref:NrfD/PsrC family molybdoenzyme membrane anchor subunit n=1 Tax=Slackia piriformis TaxID=626934 RepID=UPI0026DB3DE6